MNKKNLLGTLLVMTTVFSPLSYAMEVIERRNQTNVKRTKLASYEIGIVSQYLPFKARAELRCVNKKATLSSDSMSGYIDKYFELYDIISKLPKTDFGYEIRNIGEFLEIYNLLKQTDFRVLCIEPSNTKISSELNGSELKEFFDKISINLYTHHRGRFRCLYIILPKSYTPSYKFTPNENQQKHIKLLQQIEKMFNDELCSKPFFSNLSIWKLFELKYSLQDEAKKRADEKLTNALEDFDFLKNNENNDYDSRDIIYSRIDSEKPDSEKEKISKDYEYTNSYGITCRFKYDGPYKHPICKLFFGCLYGGIGSLAGQPHEIFKENFDIAINNLDVNTINIMKSNISSDWYTLANNIGSDKYCQHTIPDILKNLSNEKTGLDFAKNLLYVYNFIKRDDDTIEKLLNLIKKKSPVIYEKTFGQILKDKMDQLK